MPHVVQRGIAECLGLDDGAIRVISPDVGGGFGYKGLLCREEVALAWLARRTRRTMPVRWLEDCREHLTANANCREHHYRITGYADRDGRLLALDCEATCRCRRLLGLSHLVGARSGADREPAAGAL